ncbi:MAG: RNA polymerase sigma factor [Bacteroidota bacterium]
MSSTPKELTERSDESLIDAYRSSGDRELVAELYRRYHHLVYGTCLKALQDPTDSADLVVIIFEKLLTKLAELEIRNFNSWLYSLSQNECVNFLRQKQRRRQRVSAEEAAGSPQGEVYLSEAALLELENEVTVAEEPDTEADEAQIAAVRRALRQLPPEQRICVKLFFYRNKSYDQIAQKTGFSLTQVKSYLQNGKRNLKKLLAAEEEV